MTENRKMPPMPEDVAASDWLFSDGDWITAAEALARFGECCAPTIIALAADDDGSRPMLRTRCLMQETIWANGSLPDRTKHELYQFFWSWEEVSSDWTLGVFERKDPDSGTIYRAIGVQFSLDDLLTIHGSLAESGVEASPASEEDPGMKAQTPAHWKGKKILRKPYVDKMAKLIRDRNSPSRNAAANTVAENCWKEIKCSSVEAAAARLTETYNEIYLETGIPITD